MNDENGTLTNVILRTVFAGAPVGIARALFHNDTKYAFHTQSLIKSKFSNYIYLSDIYVLIINSKPFPWTLLGRWLANKLPANTVQNITFVKVLFSSSMDERNEDVLTQQAISQM